MPVLAYVCCNSLLTFSIVQICQSVPIGLLLSPDPSKGHRHHFTVPATGAETSRADEPKVPKQDSKLQRRHCRLNGRVPRAGKDTQVLR